MDIMERVLGAQLAHASKSADFVVIIGQREAESGCLSLKNMETGEQKTVDLPAALIEVCSFGAR
jgi:histidyl-tRNA synthetase